MLIVKVQAPWQALLPTIHYIRKREKTGLETATWGKTREYAGHTLSYTLIHMRTLSHLHSYPQTVIHSYTQCTLTLTHTCIHTHSHIQLYTLIHIHTLTHIQCHNLLQTYPILTHTYFLTLSCTCSHTHSLSHIHPVLAHISFLIHILTHHMIVNTYFRWRNSTQETKDNPKPVA